MFSTWRNDLPIKFTDETRSNVTVKHPWQQQQHTIVDNVNNEEFHPPVEFCANPGYTGPLCEFRMSIRSFYEIQIFFAAICNLFNPGVPEIIPPDGQLV